MFTKSLSNVAASAIAMVLMSGCMLAQDEHDDAAAAPRTTMLRIDGCAATACQYQYQQCEANSSTKCDICWDTCYDALMNGVPLNCSDACSSNCSSTCLPCTNDQSPCHDRTFQFELAEVADEALAQACSRAAERDMQCGESGIDARCEHFARVESPDAILAYDCYSALDCGSSGDGCWLPPTNLGSVVCSVLGDQCAILCEPDFATSLDLAAGWLRQDVVEQAWACVDEAACSDKVNCLNAWLGAVYPPQ